MQESAPRASDVRKGMPSDGALLAGFLVFNGLFRLALIRLNTGEYTDGILQITQFERSDSFWPPLYAALVHVLEGAGLSGIAAGRLISWAASLLLILPLWRAARAWGGRRCAFFTLILYTVSPEALRWSLRVMTDMLFTCLFHLACGALLALRMRDAATSLDGDQRAPDALPGAGSDPQDPGRSAGWAIVWITVLSVLAALTRYHGLMLLPLVVWEVVRIWRRDRVGRGDRVRRRDRVGRRDRVRRERSPGRWAAALAQMLWITLPAWLLYQRFGHVAQVAERQADNLGATLLNYWYTFEMFLFIIPYVMTLPVFLFFVVGVVRGTGKDPLAPRQARPVSVRALLLYAALAVLIAQSVFQSFQTRYLLPLLPLALTCAGAGMAHMESALSRHGRLGHRVILALVGLTVVWSLGFGLASVCLQRQAFGDVFEAGKAIRVNTGLSREARVYSNEIYKPAMVGVKLAYAAGRTVEMIPEWPYLSDWARRGGPLPQDVPRMAPGSVVAIHSAYGGPSAQSALLRLLGERYDLRPLGRGSFQASIVPLLPDIMEEPLTHQNPLAWLLRYQRQQFSTLLFVVAGDK